MNSLHHLPTKITLYVSFKVINIKDYNFIIIHNSWLDTYQMYCS